jgi:hypothetical protein
MSRKTNIGLGLVLLTLVGLCVTAALTIGSRVETLGPDKPEGVVQAYLNAVVDRDFTQALTYLDPAGKCTASDFDNAYIATQLSVTLRNTDTSGSSSTVDVSIQIGSNDPFGSGYSEQHIYRLTQSSGHWYINGVPWPLYECGVAK